MALQDAMLFFNRCENDSEFRRNLYKAEDGPSAVRVIQAAGYFFSSHEAADAVRSMKLKAKDEWRAAEIEELGQWYQLLCETDFNSSSTEGGTGSCSPSACASCSLVRTSFGPGL